MRQQDGTNWMDNDNARKIEFRCDRWLLPFGLLVACLGCQMAHPIPTGGVPSALGRGLSSSYKPPTETNQSATVQSETTQPETTQPETTQSKTTQSKTAQSKTTDSPSAVPALPAATARIRGQSPSQWNNAAPGSSSYRSPMAATDTSGTSGANVNRYANANAGGGQYATTPVVATSPPPIYTSPAQAGTGVVQPAQTPLGMPAAGGGALQPNSLAPNTSYQNPPGAIPQAYGAGGYGAGGYGYGSPGAYQDAASPSDYSSTLAPGVTQFPGSMESAIAPGAFPAYDPSGVPYPVITAPGGNGYVPRQRISPIDVFVQEARTGRIILGGSVNSDLGVAGQLVIDERNFDIRRLPTSWSDMWSGRAFRGGGQNFRAEFMPGNQVQRYTVNWTERNLFGYLPYSLSVGGFYYTRQFRDWTEQRLGGRAALGYEVTKDLSISSELRMEDVNISRPRVSGVSQLDDALGSTDLYTARFRVARDTRDSPFMSTEGALLELIFDQVFGEYDYSRGNVNYNRYFMVRERPDGGGRHTIASTWKFGVTGAQTPIFENYFAGGYSTLRGFSFRGASPKVNDVQVGGQMMFLGSLEYVFPMTADEMLRGVAFVDYGTVEQDLTIKSENFRVAPGLGLRVSVPALGPAPLAFDFAYPINHADTDDRQVFSFFMGFTR